MGPELLSSPLRDAGKWRSIVLLVSCWVNYAFGFPCPCDRVHEMNEWKNEWMKNCTNPRPCGPTQKFSSSTFGRVNVWFRTHVITYNHIKALQLCSSLRSRIVSSMPPQTSILKLSRHKPSGAFMSINPKCLQKPPLFCATPSTTNASPTNNLGKTYCKPSATNRQILTNQAQYTHWCSTGGIWNHLVRVRRSKSKRSKFPICRSCCLACIWGVTPISMWIGNNLTSQSSYFVEIPCPVASLPPHHWGGILRW